VVGNLQREFTFLKIVDFFRKEQAVIANFSIFRYFPHIAHAQRVARPDQHVPAPAPGQAYVCVNGTLCISKTHVDPSSCFHIPNAMKIRCLRQSGGTEIDGRNTFLPSGCGDAFSSVEA
jgi:hypothetical protein